MTGGRADGPPGARHGPVVAARARMGGRLSCATLALVALACGQGPQTQKCHLEREVTLWRSGATRLHAITLARGREDLVAAWSDEDGIRAAVIDEAGRIRRGPTRLLPRKASSLDAVAAPPGWRVAVLMPADLFQGGGGAELLSLDPQGAISSRAPLGPAGAYSRRIALAAGGEAVAWHDGGPGKFVVRARAGDAQREIARGRLGALAPAIARAPDGSLAVAWVELGQGKGGGVGGAVRLQRFEPDLRQPRPARTVARTSVEDADPVLVPRGDDFTIVFRDQRDGDRRAGAYVLARGAAPGREVRVARANGPRGPDVVYCHGTYASAAVRTYSHELLLGFNRFDEAGQKKSGELQIYSDRVHFAAVEIECLARGWALLYAEEHPQGARLLYNRVTCRE